MTCHDAPSKAPGATDTKGAWIQTTNPPSTDHLQRAANETTFEQAWATLGPSFDAIRQHSQSKVSFEELWRLTYNVSLKYGGEELYKHVINTEQTWLEDEVRTKVFQNLGSGTILRVDRQNPGPTWREAKVNGERLMQAVRHQYTDHQLCLTQISSFLMRVDRDYCPMANLPTFHEKGTSLFRDCILRSPLDGVTSQQLTGEAGTLLDLLPQVILDHVAMARAGELVETHLIKACTTMFEWLPDNDDTHEITSLYSTVFEVEYLKSSVQFFRQESETLLKEVDVRSYCRRVKSRILEEQERCSSSLQERTAPLVVKIIELEMINNKMGTLVDMDTGIPYMIENDSEDDIRLIYQLESRVDKDKSEVTRSLQNIIRKAGRGINEAITDLAAAPPPAAAEASREEQSRAPVDKSINQQTVAALKWVEDILSLKDKFDTIWQTCLQEDKIMQPALTRTFADVINSYNRCSEFISLYIDEHMKKGIKGKTEPEVELVLDKAITLVRYLQDKDLFEKYYKKHLCKRLLMGRSLSIDVEKSMIGRMKIELGNSFTTKLEAMFKDMTLSDELTAGYKKHVASLGQREAGAIDLSINVLTSMTWPLETMRGLDDERADRIKTIFPPALERLKESFAQFYGQRHSGRVLSWQANMGTADIKATFPKVPNKETGGTKVRVHDLNVSTYAMIVLVLFNDLEPGASLTYEEIQDRTRIPDNDLKRNLQSLAVAPKTRILLKQPMTKDVKPTDRFIFNEAFQGKFVKIKVGVVTAGNRVENDRERKETETANNDSRGFVVEAAIVRIMKQRKETSHAELISETLAQLASQFKPDVGLVKKKIEMLIDREYLERMDEAAVPSYRYLA